MSYKVALFGVPASTAIADVLGQVVPMAQELRSENGYGAVYLATTSDDDARRVGLRPLYFAAPGARGGVPRDFFTERWDGPLFEMAYDDQHGIFLWTHYPGTGKAQSILSDGHHVGLSNITPAVDYPQKQFTSAQLDAAFKKPEAQRTPAEARALMEYHDAITIGLGHHGFAMKRVQLLDLVHAKTAWALLNGKPAPKPFPREAAPIASHYIEPYVFRAHGLVPRDY